MASIYIEDNTGAQYDFQSGKTGTFIDYFAPGKTGTWKWVIERLGFQRQSGFFTPGVGGDFAADATWTPDTGLVVTDPVILAAKTLLNNPNDVLDYNAYRRTLAAGIKYSKISKDGTSTDFGDANVNWVTTGTEPMTYNSATNTFTIKTTGQEQGSTLYSYRTTGTFTIESGLPFNVAYKDSAGLRVSVYGLDPQGFGVTWFLRWKKPADTVWQYASGTGNTSTILVDEALYQVECRVPGYDWEASEIDASKTLLLDMALRYHVSANNTPQWTMTYDAVLEAIFTFDPVAEKVKVTNTSGSILQPGFAEVYRATQRIQHIPALVWTWVNPVTANSTSQKIIIPTGNPIQMFLSNDSTASVKLTCPVIHESTGASADDRVRGNSSGYAIILGSPATAESAGLVSQIGSLLGGPSFETDLHGLSVIKADQDLAKAVLDLVKSAVDAIKPRTDLIPDQPAAVGDQMTLTSAYDAAKTAATQASVDALGTPLQASNYVAPANSDIASIKATVEAIEPTDLSGIPGAVRTELATELGRIDVAVSTRSTLTAEDIPEGLTAAEVWSATTRTLTQSAGLTPEQEATLNAIPTLAEIENSSALAKEATTSAIRAKTDNLPANPAAVGSQMTLTSAYDAAKNAASQASVDAKPTLAQIEASAVLAKEDSVQDVGDLVAGQ